MPRLARIAIPGVPHHVTQRGNNRQDIFFAVEDRSFYLEWLAKYASEAGLDILGYCLMTNHIHLVVVPHEEDSLADGLGRAHWRYSQMVNRLHGRSGHLWQGRFFSCALDDEHAYGALAYVERNPVEDRGQVLYFNISSDSWPMAVMLFDDRCSALSRTRTPPRTAIGLRVCHSPRLKPR